ncbi:MAG: nucleotidyltransferase domain-containing protein [Candidatus Omnitrophica bacterium]|nr:nucleotidyltransferase domain-containing protein [Candidatus Omnitrophota bacterium]
MNKLRSILISTNSQKVLDFFLDYPEKEFIEKDIQRYTKISKSGVNYALRELAKVNILFRNRKGKMYLYSLNYKDPAVRQLKILKAVAYMRPIIKKLRKLSSKIILFGSLARGEDFLDSDIDLFIVSNKKEEIEKGIAEMRFKRKIQLVIRTELGEIELKRKNPVFYKQIQRGIILWEKE